MNELIPVASRQIGGETVLSSDARDLHAYLNPGTDFNMWIARRIDEYGFEEGKDFQSFLGESTGGRPPKEYIVSLGMAKELAMVERTPKGKDARQYYIECERRVLEGEAIALHAPANKKASAIKPPRASERYREAAVITREQLKICKLLGVDEGMAKVVTAKEVRNVTGLDFTPLLTHVTVTENPPMTPKEIAEHLGGGVTSEMVNSALEQLGFQVKKHWETPKGQPRSKWILTESGKEFGAMAPYQAEKQQHAGYRAVWYAKVIELIQPMVEVAIAQRAAAKAIKRPKKATPATSEPQGALL